MSAVVARLPAHHRSWDDYSLGRDTAQAHLGALDKVYDGVVGDHRQAIAVAGEVDPVTEDMLIGQTAELEKFQWFIRAHLENAGGNLPTADDVSEKGAAPRRDHLTTRSNTTDGPTPLPGGLARFAEQPQVKSQGRRRAPPFAMIPRQPGRQNRLPVFRRRGGRPGCARGVRRRRRPPRLGNGDLRELALISGTAGLRSETGPVAPAQQAP